MISGQVVWGGKAQGLTFIPKVFLYKYIRARICIWLVYKISNFGEIFRLDTIESVKMMSS